ncbi:MAG: type IV pilus assembly protein PilM [Sporomusaceae bacterium]|nr:type IV pilus assembly protein PilM [Sporomusaceae bacterium]
MVGLDIGTGFIKAAEISFAQAVPLLKAVAVARIPEELNHEGQIADFRALGEFLAKLWSQQKLSCRNVTAAINSRHVFLREITLPAMSRAELAAAIKWDLGNYIPYEENSCYYDFAPTTSESGQESRALLAAALKETVDNVAAALFAAGCKVWAIDIEALAAQETIETAAGKISVIVDIGQFQSQIIIFSEKIPVLTRVIPWGGQRFTEIMQAGFELELQEAEAFKLRPEANTFRQKFALEDFYAREAKIEKEIKNLIVELTAEIESVTAYYLEKNPAKSVQHIYLTGGGANLKNLVTGMERKFAPLPLQVPDPLTKLKIASDLNEDYLKSVAPQLNIAVGLALRGGRL